MQTRQEISRLSPGLVAAQLDLTNWEQRIKAIYEAKKSELSSCPRPGGVGVRSADLDGDNSNLSELIRGYIDHSMGQIISKQKWDVASGIQLARLLNKYLPRAIDEVGEWAQLVRLEIKGACKDPKRLATEFILERSSKLVYTLLKLLTTLSLLSKQNRIGLYTELSAKIKNFIERLLSVTQKITSVNQWLESNILGGERAKREKPALLAGISLNPDGEEGQEVPTLTQRLANLKEVGSGGFGTVYRGTPLEGTETAKLLPKGDEYLAVKKIVPEKPKHRQSILEEIRGLFSFQCPSRRMAIASPKLLQHAKPYCAFFKALDAWSEVVEGKYTVFIMMPYFEGGLTGRSLLKYPSSSKFRLLSMTLVESLDWLRWVSVSLGQAIAHIHSKFMVHRDLKPENFLWKESEQRLYLADYGLLCDEKEEDKESGSYCSYGGTPSFMDPLVQYQSAKSNALSDSYSLGSSLYEFLHYIFERKYAHWFDGDKESSSTENMMKLRARHRIFQNETVPKWKRMIEQSYPEIEVLIDGVSLMLEPEEREMRPTVKSFTKAVAKGKFELLLEK